VYAIIEDGGKQYRVCLADVVDVERRQIASGQNTIELDQVLLVKNDEGTYVGTPTLEGAKIVAKVTGSVKGRKLKMLKLRRRKNSRTHKGHRQEYLRVSISEIHSGA